MPDLGYCDRHCEAAFIKWAACTIGSVWFHVYYLTSSRNCYCSGEFAAVRRMGHCVHIWGAVGRRVMGIGSVLDMNECFAGWTVRHVVMDLRSV